MAGIQIGIASETKAFKQGIETGLIEPLEDAVQALDDLGKSKGPDKLEDSLEDAQDASKKLEREVKDTADTIEKEFRKSYADLKNSSDKGIDGAKQGLDEFKQEANSTAKESAASFDGSFESIVDMAQETAANAFAGFGPAGAAAGLAVAGGIGLAVAAIEGAGESAEDLEEKIVGLFDQMIESQSKYLAQEFINENIKTVTNDTEQMADANRIATDAGVDLSVVIRAMAGDQAALSEVQGTAADKAENLAEKVTAQKDATGRASEADLKRLEALQKVRGEFETQEGVYADAGRRYDLYTKATTDSTFANDVSLKSVDKLTDGVGRLGSGLGRIPPETNPKVNVRYDIDDSKLRNAVNKSYTVTIRGELLDRQGRKLLI